MGNVPLRIMGLGRSLLWYREASHSYVLDRSTSIYLPLLSDRDHPPDWGGVIFTMPADLANIHLRSHNHAH